MDKKIGVVFGGRSVEHKVSVVSARTVAAALQEAGFEVIALGIAQDGCWVPPAVGRRALDGELDVIDAVGERVASSLRHLLGAEVDVIFPIVHGTWGEDGTLQGLCEMLDLPYVGTGVASSAVCMDKVLAKQVLQASGLPVVDFEAVERRDLHGPDADAGAVCRRLDRLGWPLFVKPAIGGSSVGVRKVDGPDDLLEALEHALRFDERLVVEKAVVGRELECAVLGYDQMQASGLGEIVPGRDFYDYADKYLEDGAELILRAELEPELETELRRLAVEAFRAVGGWGMARVDFLLDESGSVGGIAINEINTLPGFTAISMYPTLWREAGLQTSRLVKRLVKVALERHADRRRLDDGIKEWIASLGG